jgi:cytochrome c-type biogenesis protein CcmF
LFALRAPRVVSGGQFDFVSRETLLLANNVLLTVACATVLLGTLYPLAVDALGAGKISVGPPYFNTVFGPLMVPLLFLVALGPQASWRSASLPELIRRSRAAFAFAVVGGLALPFALGGFSPVVALGLFLVLWVVACTFLQVRTRLAGSGGAAAFARQPASWWGMHLAHLGLAVCVVGVVVSRGYETDREVRMAPGDVLTLSGYSMRLVGLREAQGPNFRSVVGEIELSRDGKLLKLMRPEKRTYFSSEMPMTEAAIHSRLTRDVYISIGEPLGNGAWSVHAYVKPYVGWIWGGLLLMAIGGLMAVADRRYRARSRAHAPAGAAAQQA